MMQTLIFDKMIGKRAVYSYYFSRDNENELDNYFIIPNDIIIRQMGAGKCYVTINEKDFTLIKRVGGDIFNEIDDDVLIDY